MESMTDYKGYNICEYEDGTYEILDSSMELVDGDFKSEAECKEYIDEKDSEVNRDETPVQDESSEGQD